MIVIAALIAVFVAVLFLKKNPQDRQKGLRETEKDNQTVTAEAPKVEAKAAKKKKKKELSYATMPTKSAKELE